MSVIGKWGAMASALHAYLKQWKNSWRVMMEAHLKLLILHRTGNTMTQSCASEGFKTEASYHKPTFCFSWGVILNKKYLCVIKSRLTKRVKAKSSTTARCQVCSCFTVVCTTSGKMAACWLQRGTEAHARSVQYFYTNATFPSIPFFWPFPLRWGQTTM